MTLVYILIGIIVIPILLLAIPIHIEYFYNNRVRLKSQMRLVWLFGLVRISSASSRKDKERAARTGGSRVKEKRKFHKSTRQKRKSGKALLAAIASEGFLSCVFRLLYQVLTVAKIKQLQACVRFGLNDPADTGRLYGLLAPAFSILYAIPRVDFVATPVFDRVGVETNIQTRIRVVPIHYIKAVLLFVFTKESLRAARAAIRAYYS